MLLEFIYYLFHKYSHILAVIGASFLARLILRELCGFCSGFRAFFLAPMGIGRLDLKKYGSWAVVTGASEGIGRGYALELAKRGLNVVLMSRSEEKLNKVAAEIKEKFGQETKVIPVDFSEGQEIYSLVADQLDSLDVGVLVNNVGFGHPPSPICGVDPQILYNIVQINCQASVQMSRILLPKMTQKGGGVIVNISSIISASPVPMIAVYSATKVLVNYLSDGIRKEYGRKGIIVQTVTPAIVSTNADMPKPNVIVPDPITYARAAVATIGIQNNTFGYFRHAIQGYVFNKLPRSLIDSLLRLSEDPKKKAKLQSKTA